MERLLDVISADLAEVYKEVAETVSIDNAYNIFYRFKGLQLMFLLKFYSSGYIVRQINEEYDGKDIWMLSRGWCRLE